MKENPSAENCIFQLYFLPLDQFSIIVLFEMTVSIVLNQKKIGFIKFYNLYVRFKFYIGPVVGLPNLVAINFVHLYDTKTCDQLLNNYVYVQVSFELRNALAGQIIACPYSVPRMYVHGKRGIFGYTKDVLRLRI